MNAPALIGCLLAGLAPGLDGAAARPAAIESHAPLADADVTQHVWTLLAPPPGKKAIDEAAIVRAIAGLGAAAVRPTLGIYLGLVPEPETEAAVDGDAIRARPRILLAAISKLPRADVLDQIDRTLTVQRDVDLQVALARVLGQLGGSGAVERVVRIASELDPLQWERTFVQVPLEETLSALIVGDARESLSLATQIQRSEPALASIYTRAIVRADAWQCTPTLLQAFGRDARLDVSLLEAVGSFGDRVSGTLPEAAMTRMRAMLGSGNPRVVAAAATTLAVLGDSECASRLVDLLEHSDSSRRLAASTALRTLTSVSLDANSAAWRAWLERESTWAAESLPELEGALVEPDAETLSSVIAELRQHQLYRHRGAALVAQVIAAAEDPEVAAFACSALPAFRSGASLAALRPYAERGDQEVRAAARAALARAEAPSRVVGH